MKRSRVRVKRLNKGVTIPKKAKKNDAAYDIRADLNGSPEEVYIKMSLAPGERKWISTGLAFSIPKGYYGKVHARSGLSSQGVDVGAGVIDSNYRGEVKVLLINNGNKDLEVGSNQKIAQMTIEKIHPDDELEEVEDFDHETDKSERGTDGFGSTGNF